ncbi:hypothetical protein AK830_g4435 [Neonectria ditissima]|uniref:Ecp2 effector protein domain-containing protein n=1 Tax=Neonectria ditissima TaxID=78410 RepID=A0A0P7BLE1_9HYPO|nr:hypothetical protein AK830_g4435 [Neonectria ditissima]
MLLQPSLFLVLSSVSFCFGQDATPTVTVPDDGLGVMAIVPTTTGQIGINPVDIPPPESFSAKIGVDSDYLTEVVVDESTSTKWIGVETDFGIATITTTDQDGTPKETTVPQGIRAVLNEGKLEITLSQWFKDQMVDIASNLPAVSLRKRRVWDPRKHQHVETRAVDVSSLTQRITRFGYGIVQHPAARFQLGLASGQIAYASGNDTAVLAESEQMVSFVDEDIVSSVAQNIEAEAVAAGDTEALATLGSASVGILGSLAFFFGTVTILEDLWKLRADPQPPMPFYRVKHEDDSCPDHDLACAGTLCQGHKGKCTDSFYFGADWVGVEDEIQQFVFGSDPDATQSIPQPSCTSSSGGDRNLAQRGVRCLVSFCEDNPKLSEAIDKTMKTSDLGLDSYEGWTFDFELETTAEKGCSAYDCVDLFGKFAKCTYGSHTKYKTGKLELECGIAKYAMHNPDDGEETPEEKPKTALKMQNDKCYGADDFGDHGDIQKRLVREYSGWACAATAIDPVKAGEKDTFRHFNTVESGVPYQYNIYWKDGCELETGQTEMYPANPLDEDKPRHTKCQEILIDNYKRCINGGVGGSIKAGCLVYEFKAEKASD